MTIFQALLSFLLASPYLQLSYAASKADYTNNALEAADTLHDWYDGSTGLFDMGWWTSANALTTIGNLALINDASLGAAEDMFATTFAKAPYSNVSSKYNVERGTFLDDFYDDEGWWALASIKAFDLTNNATYLEEAQAIFEDIDGATNGACGGRPWGKAEGGEAINAITNELFFAVAASLANRVSDNKDFYRGLAQYQADWFYSSGLLGSGGNDLIVDGIDTSTCQPNTSAIVWSYNQGVILGAFVEMNDLPGDQRYLDSAKSIAQGTTAHMVSSDGILTEHGFPEVTGDGEQFKGVFARNLMYLHRKAPDQGYVDFLQKNADSIWMIDRDTKGKMGVNWQGPVKNVDAVSHGSALDCLVAAAAVSA